MKRKIGFTLAEVLITLGIIGVVAALTIPLMIQSNNKRVVETSLAKFYSNINNAVKLSEVQNGKWLYLDEGASVAELFNKYLIPYLSVVDVKSNSPDSIEIYLSDGSMFAATNSDINFYPKASDKDKNPVMGKNVFKFHFSAKQMAYHENLGSDRFHVGKGIEPYMWAWDGSEESLKTGGGNSNWGCHEGAGNAMYCTKLIQSNGWKIPDDYPFKF